MGDTADNNTESKAVDTKYKLVIEQDDVKAPEVDKPSESKTQEQPGADAANQDSVSKKADSDSVRTDLATNSKFLTNLLGRNRSKANKAEEGKKTDEKSATSGEGKAGGESSGKAKEKPAEKSEKPADSRVEKILGIKAPKESEPPKKEEVPHQPVVDGAQIASAAASAAVAAVTAATKKQDADTKADTDYPEAYKEDAKTFDRMAAMNPKKYGDIKAQLNDFTQKETEYRSLWEAKNDGQQFDPEDPEHAKFYAKNSPDIDEEDIEAAEKAIRLDEVNELVERGVQKRLEPIEARQRAESVVPVIQSGMAALATETIKAILPDVDVSKLTPDMVSKLEDENPKQVEIINEAAAMAGAVFQEYVKITNGVAKLDQSNPAHSAVVDAVSRAQEFIKSRPKDELVRVGDDGVRREFIPIEEFARLSKTQQSKYWTVGTNEILGQLQVDASQFAQDKWEKERKVLEKYGVKLGSKEQQPTKEVRQSSQQIETKTEQKTQEKQRIQVSQAGAERGGSGEGPAVSTIESKSMFANLMKGIRPRRVG